MFTARQTAHDHAATTPENSVPMQQPSRRAFMAIAATAGAALGAATIGGSANSALAHNGERFMLPQVKASRELRGTWIATVANIDWPKSSTSSAATQQAELRALLDQAKANRLNAVFFQVRPLADALYNSAIAPWSALLTGTQGKNPGWDPLAFAIKEARARGLQLHAWLNPYRITQKGTDPATLAATNAAVTHPEWTFEFNGGIFFNPGIPAVHNHLLSVVAEITSKYDVDGIHFDDYFYPYPVAGNTIADSDAYATNNPGKLSLSDWRRDNVNRLVRECGITVHRNRPHAQFGISPFGIWRNLSSDSRGSNTTGLESYDGVFADTLAWVKNRWVDYVAPQVYWDMNLSVAAYGVLIPWWANAVKGTGVKLYIGEASYKIGTGGAWDDPQEMLRHLALCAKYPQVRGNIWFNASVYFKDPLGTTTLIRNGPYRNTAPASAGAGAPSRPNALLPVRGNNSIAINIMNFGGVTAGRFMIYRATGDKVGNPMTLTDRDVIGTAFNRGDINITFVDRTAHNGVVYTYFVTAVSDAGGESAPVMTVAR